jgi:hypothetical protein
VGYATHRLRQAEHPRRTRCHRRPRRTPWTRPGTTDSSPRSAETPRS